MIETELWKLRRGPHDVVTESTVSVDTTTTQHDVSESEQEIEKNQDEGMSITAAKKNGARTRTPGRFKPPKTTAYKATSKLTKSTPTSNSKSKSKSNSKPKSQKKTKTKTKKRQIKIVSGVNAGDLIELNPQEIVVDKGANPRKLFDKQELESLAINIKLQGLLQPISVYWDDCGDKKYHLILGERRLRAIKSLQWPTIPAIVKVIRKSEDDDGVIALMRIIENMVRKDLAPLEDAHGIQQILGKKIVDKEGNLVVATAKTVAESIGVTSGWVVQRLKAADLPQRVLHTYEAGTISYSQLRELSSLDTSEDQLAVFDMLMQCHQAGQTMDIAITKRCIEKYRAAQRKGLRRTRKGPAKPQKGRPFGGQQTELPNVKLGLETALARLTTAPIKPRNKTELRESVATLYDRYHKARSDEKKMFWEGAIAYAEWVANFRDTF